MPESEPRPLWLPTGRALPVYTPPFVTHPPHREQVSYNVWMGANVQLFSSSKAEAKLLAMRSQNHWDLPIARAAARVADFLWPDCQTVVDEAMAKGKVMKNTRGIEADDVYMPPKVPEFLPITYWCAAPPAPLLCTPLLQTQWPRRVLQVRIVSTRL